jgi:hypothetical protein
LLSAHAGERERREKDPGKYLNSMKYVGFLEYCIARNLVIYTDNLAFFGMVIWL